MGAHDHLVTGGSAEDRGPVGCVVRFIQAGLNEDFEAGVAEIHPDHREGINPTDGPKDLASIVVGEATPQGDVVLVPVQMTNLTGEQQPFVFAVRPNGDGWGLDFEASMKASFGGMDPLQMLQDTMTEAFKPIGEAFSQIGEAMSNTFGSPDQQETVWQTLAITDPLPDDDLMVPDRVVAHIVECEQRQWRSRSRPDDDFSSSMTIQVRLWLDLEPEWSALACLGANIDAAMDLDGADLRPSDQGTEMGSESYASWEREDREFRVRLPLQAANTRFRGLASLSGRVRLSLCGGPNYEVMLGTVGELLHDELTIPCLHERLRFARNEDGRLSCHCREGFFDRIVEMEPIGSDGYSCGSGWSGESDGVNSVRTWYDDIPDDAVVRLRFRAISAQAEMAFDVSDLPFALE